jgi:hypothetical protein
MASPSWARFPFAAKAADFLRMQVALLRAFGGGARLVCAYRYRTPRQVETDG